MCGGGSAPKDPPKQPPAQPPPIIESAPEVAVGNQSEGVSKRKKIGRSQLRQTSSASTGAPASGVGR